MKNVVLKTCLTTLVLAMSGLASAADVTVSSSIETTLAAFESGSGSETPLLINGYSAIAGGALSVAAESKVKGHVAAQAAITIGALTHLGEYNTVYNSEHSKDVFAGAAVTIGAGAWVGKVHAAAAAGVAANAYVHHIQAGAAVTLGAPSYASDIQAGAAITLGAGSTAQDVNAAAAITGATLRTGNDAKSGNVDSSKDIRGSGVNDMPYIGTTHIEPMTAFDISGALKAIETAQVYLFGLTKEDVDGNGVHEAQSLETSMVGGTQLAGVYEGSALNIPADSKIYITDDAIINLSDALTLGANTKIVITPGKSVIWNVGSALNLGAGTQFAGTAFVNGSVSGATADVCGDGSLYAAGALAIGSIGEPCL
ncbi:MAG: hypothetical protein ACI97K_001234 [Glaciecola sp.]|jgi:carbonic anhydrase/acetyltransferase-like protein (isoleucine patch superfamily)